MGKPERNQLNEERMREGYKLPDLEKPWVRLENRGLVLALAEGSRVIHQLRYEDGTYAYRFEGKIKHRGRGNNTECLMVNVTKNGEAHDDRIIVDSPSFWNTVGVPPYIYAPMDCEKEEWWGSADRDH